MEYYDILSICKHRQSYVPLLVQINIQMTQILLVQINIQMTQILLVHINIQITQILLVQINIQIKQILLVQINIQITQILLVQINIQMTQILRLVQINIQITQVLIAPIKRDDMKMSIPHPYYIFTLFSHCSSKNIVVIKSRTDPQTLFQRQRKPLRSCTPSCKPA